MPTLVYRFLHYVPFDPRDGEIFSFFEQFSVRLFQFAPIVNSILVTPPDLTELYMAQDEAVRARISGVHGYHISFLRYEEFKTVTGRTNMPFAVIHSTRRTFEWTKEWVAHFNQPILHVSDVDDRSTILRNAFNRSTLRTFVEHLAADYIAKTASEQDIALLRGILDAPYSDKTRPTGLTIPYSHPVNLPNQLTLRSADYTYAEYPRVPNLTFAPPERPPSLFEIDAPIFACIVDSAKAIEKLRKEVTQNHGTLPVRGKLDLVVAAPAFDHIIYHPHQTPLASGGPSEQYDLIRAARRIVRLKSMRLTDSPNEQHRRLLNSVPAKALLAIRHEETQTFLSLAAIKAADSFAPTLFVGPSINFLRPQIKRIGDCARGLGPHRAWKLGKLMKSLADQMTACLPDNYLQFFDGHDKSIKLITDVPLEWLRIGGLPLSIRHSTTRIPSTPGDLMGQTCVHNESLYISAENFAKIIVIRTIERSDNRYGLFDATVRRAGIRDRVSFEDADSVSHLFDILDRRDHRIIILTSHGTQQAGAQLGGLIVGGVAVDALAFRDHMPKDAIVILSACDTHPFDRSSASVANQLLHLDINSVLATALPVHAQYSADFIVMLLCYLMQLVDHTGSDYFVDSWAKIVTFAQRCCFVRECELALAAALSRTIAPSPNDVLYHLVRHQNECWWQEASANIKVRVDASNDVFSKFLDERFGHTECLNYVLLGNAETIWIRSDRYRKVHHGAWRGG